MKTILARGRQLAALLLLLTVLLLPSGCNSSDDTISGPLTYSVLYQAAGDPIADGTVVFNRILYDDAEGNEVEVTEFDNPSSWSEAIVLDAGGTIFLRLEGTVTSASLAIQVVIQTSDGQFFVRSNSTPYDNGTFFVQIPRETLP